MPLQSGSVRPDALLLARRGRRWRGGLGLGGSLLGIGLTGMISTFRIAQFFVNVAIPSQDIRWQGYVVVAVGYALTCFRIKIRLRDNTHFQGVRPFTRCYMQP